MNELQKELLRQIEHLTKEVAALRERVAVMEYRVYSMPVYPKNPWDPPFTVTCATGTTGIAGRD